VHPKSLKTMSNKGGCSNARGPNFTGGASGGGGGGNSVAISVPKSKSVIEKGGLGKPFKSEYAQRRKEKEVEVKHRLALIYLLSLKLAFYQTPLTQTHAHTHARTFMHTTTCRMVFERCCKIKCALSLRESSHNRFERAHPSTA
jgi:hypothetical protein